MWYERPITRSDHWVATTREIAKKYGIKYSVYDHTKDPGTMGEAYSWRSEIKVYLKRRQYPSDRVTGMFQNDGVIPIPYDQLTLREFLSVFFHEVAHVLNFRNKKFYLYHSLPTQKNIKEQSRQRLRAERYTDRVGAKLMREHLGDDIPYSFTYIEDTNGQAKQQDTI